MKGEMEVAQENKEKVIFVDLAREAILEEGTIFKKMYFCRTAGSLWCGRAAQGTNVSEQRVAGQGHS